MGSEQTDRVAEIRARHAEYPPPEWSEVAILLAALAAAETERDHARRELALQQGSFAAVVAERDQARQRATRLEQACRALVYGGRPVLFGVQAIHDALTALAAPPGEEA